MPNVGPPNPPEFNACDLGPPNVLPHDEVEPEPDIFGAEAVDVLDGSND